MTPKRLNKAPSTVRVPSSSPGMPATTHGRSASTPAVSASSTVAAALTVGLAGAVFAFGEISHRISSTRRLGTGTSAGGDEVIIVLGFRNTGRRANRLNRFRVRAGLRSIDPGARTSTVLFCGGCVAGDLPEAELMERFAREELKFTGRTILETVSTSTWENIANAIAIIDAEFGSGVRPTAVKIVSNSHHAEKARDHLWQMRPDLGRRLARGADYRFGELPLVKPVAAALGLAALRRLSREGGAGD